ncbi:MAG TPA: general stress protein CsbD [Chitinophagaceae bacterium]|nr:general stress protein CsbD [Chitinophagaceae bacterium]
MQNTRVKLNLRSPWEQVKEKMKENDHTLTDDDLDYPAGHEDELIARLEKVMGKPREQIIAYIESISANTDLAG